MVLRNSTTNSITANIPEIFDLLYSLHGDVSSESLQNLDYKVKTTDSILITSVIDNKQGRDVMTSDVPNAFVQCKVNQINGERIVMKIRRALVHILVDLDTKLYADHVVYYGKNKILYVLMLKGLYGMLIASLLYYRRFVKDIKKIAFVLNPYDLCTTNRIINGLQHTIA